MIKNPFSPFALLGRFTVGRFFIFRKELATLWRGFRHKATPLHVKFLMLLVPLYLVSPVDLIPDVIPFLGVLDDFIVVPMLVAFIVKMLPLEVTGQKVRASARPYTNDDRGPTIDGTSRRR